MGNNKKRYEDSGTDKGTEKYRIQLGTASPTVKKNYIHIGPKSDSTKKPLDTESFKYDPLDKDYKPLTSTTNFSITSRGEFSGDKYSWGEPKSKDLYSTQIDSKDIAKTRLQIDAALNPGNSGPIVDENTVELVAVLVAELRKDVNEKIISKPPYF